MCSEIPKTTIQVLFLQYVIQSFSKEKKTTRKQIKRIKKRNKHTLTLVSSHRNSKKCENTYTLSWNIDSLCRKLDCSSICIFSLS